MDEFFEELMVFTKKLDEEEKRARSENLSEEELTLHDLLLKKGLNEEEKDKVK